MSFRKEVYTKIIPQKVTLEDGTEVEKNQRMIRGVYCPKCKQFYPIANSLVVCNACGWKAKPRLKPHELKRYARDMGKADRVVNSEA